jgi:hypothetical protein
VHKRLTPCVTHDARYEYGKLVEINSHSLFSKWFSESGKLVQRLFAQVTELVEDEASFVVVLIGTFWASPEIREKGRSRS